MEAVCPEHLDAGGARVRHRALDPGYQAAEQLLLLAGKLDIELLAQLGADAFVRPEVDALALVGGRRLQLENGVQFAFLELAGAFGDDAGVKPGDVVVVILPLVAGVVVEVVGAVVMDDRHRGVDGGLPVNLPLPVKRQFVPLVAIESMGEEVA